jgi:tRNA threonylcarbamoyladenosine biosynthesis protein TsaE
VGHKFEGSLHMEFIVNNIEETTNIGFKLGELLNSSDIICLTGDLGTGKTHITKGIAKGLNINDIITSPTFNIVNEYDSGRLKLNHFDVYRVNDPDEIYAIGFDDYIFSDAVSVIEWANYIEEILPKEYLHIHISKDLTKGENHRIITLIGYGDRYDYIKELKI